MAETVSWYGKAAVHLDEGDFDWPSDTIKLALTTSAYAVSLANDEFFSDVTHELAGTGGYTAGGIVLAGKSRSYDPATRKNILDADDVAILALTPSAAFRYGVIYKDSGTPSTSPLIALVNFSFDRNPAGLPFAIQWPSDGVIYERAQ